jgi:hypothetical protein
MAEIGTEADAPLWGVSAEFDNAPDLLAAIQRLRPRRLGRIDGFSPVPLEEARAALGFSRPPMWLFALGGVVLGGLGVLAMCVYATGYDYVFLIGGRPRISWPAYVIPSFSVAMATGTLATLAGFLVLNRLPRLNHPVFHVPGFLAASRDRFFIVVERVDDQFDAEAIEQALAQLAVQPRAVRRVPR